MLRSLPALPPPRYTDLDNSSYPDKTVCAEW
jgi:hypothetical protein